MMMECGHVYERQISELNKDIDSLNCKNHDLQTQLDAARQKLSCGKLQKMDLDSRNINLEQELLNVEQLSRNMCIEKSTAVTSAAREIADLKRELDVALAEKLDIQACYSQLETENRYLTSEAKTLQNSSVMLGMDTQELSEIVAKVQEDKLRLSQRIEKLTANERSLVLEIERLKRHGHSSKSRDTMNQIDSYMKGIEVDRDYWRGEANLLNELCKSTVLANASRSASPAGRSRSQKTSKMSASKSPSKLGTNNRVRQLENEKMALRDQIESLKRQNSLRNSRSPTRNPGLENDVGQLRRERDELRNLLNKLERRVSEIQGNVRVITQERDRFSNLYDEARQDIHKLHHNIQDCQKTEEKNSTVAHQTIQKLENIREDNTAQLERLSAEKERFLERYKTTVDAANEDRSLLEKTIDELNCKLRKTRSERENLAERSEKLRHRISELENVLKDLEMDAAHRQSQLDAEMNAVAQSRSQIECLQRNVESHEREISQLKSQLHEANEKKTAVEMRNLHLSNDVQVQRDENALIQRQNNKLDEDKDHLKTSLAEASQRITEMDIALRNTEKDLVRSREKLSISEQQLIKITEASNSKDREINGLHRQVDCVTRRLEDTELRCQTMAKEANSLQDELCQMNSDRQVLRNRLDDANEEREELRQKAQEYIAEIKKCEDILGQKENEQNQMMEQYRYLAEEGEKIRQQLQKCKMDLRQNQSDITERDIDIEDLRKQVLVLEKDCQEKRNVIRDLEVERSNLNCTLSGQVEQGNSLKREREAILADLSALRDVCNKLEKTKEAMHSQVESSKLDVEQIQAQMDDLERENERMRDEISIEQENNRNTQIILQTSRDKEQSTNLDLQERLSDIKVLKERINAMDDRINDSQNESNRYRSKVSDLERDVERVQRALTNEKFEKERALSELRIATLTPGYQPSSYSNMLASTGPVPCRPCSRGC